MTLLKKQILVSVLFFLLPLMSVGQKSKISLFLCDSEGFSKINEDSCCNVGVNCCRTIPSKFDFIFESGCFPKGKNQNSITAQYITIYDERDGRISYLKLKKSALQRTKKSSKKKEVPNNSSSNAKGDSPCSKDTCKAAFEYVEVMKKLIPKSDHEMLVIIISKDDNFVVEADGEQYFLEHQDAFKENLENLGTKQEDVDRSNNKIEENSSDAKALGTLEDAVVFLNRRHTKIAVFQDRYYADLTCLRYSIMNEFGLPNFVSNSIHVDSLVKEATILKLSLSELKNLNEKDLVIINSIEKSYLSLILKQIDRFKVFYHQVRIPNQDIFKLEVTTQGEKKTDVFNRTFKTRGGFKIDFSTGVFLTGLSIPEYVVQKHSFKYKPAIFGLDSLGNIDTTYSSSLRDTSGHMIHIKDPIANYGVGLLAHAYVRTGTFFNVGLSTGVLVNNVGVQILIGASTMFSVKKSRLSLTGGVVIGQKKVISPTAAPYLRDENSPSDGTVYNLPTEVPAFFEPTDIPTLVQWNCSWFFGLTYNFGSVSIPIKP